MDEQPSNGELGRRLDQIFGSLQALIGRPEYDAGQRALDLRLAGIGRDLEDLRKQHSEDLEKQNARITDDIEKVYQRISDEAKAAAARGQWRATLAASLFPVLVAVAAILVTIWLHGGAK